MHTQLFLFFIMLSSFTATAQTSLMVTPASSGWYEIDTAPRTLQEFQREHAVRELYAARIRKCMDALPENLQARLPTGGFVISIYDPTHGGTRMTGITDGEEARREAIEVVLYGEATDAQEVLPARFHYASEWGAVFVPGVRVNDTWFCAAFTHELFHAKTHDSSLILAEDVRQRVLEEIDAHEMERDLLDLSTGGVYRTALTDVLREETAIDLASIFKKIEAVNAIFPPAQSEVELSIRYAQIYFDLAFTMLERNNSVSPEVKIGMYLSLREMAESGK